jgi:hypothetical protein
MMEFKLVIVVFDGKTMLLSLLFYDVLLPSEKLELSEPQYLHSGTRNELANRPSVIGTRTFTRKKAK